MEDQELSQKSEESQSNRVAKIPIAIPLLEQMLPPGTVVLGVQTQDYHHTIELVVSHPSFDELKDGERIPTRMLMAYRKYCKEGDHSYVSKVEYAS